MERKNFKPGISDNDLALIENVVEELRFYGVIEKTSRFEGLDEKTLREVLKKAVEASLTERELNPDHYDKTVDQGLSRSESELSPHDRIHKYLTESE